MNYLITAAGKGTRFLNQGIKPPKPLIRVLGNELLLWSLKTFNFNKQDKIYIVTFKEHKVKEKIQYKLKKMLPNIEVNWLELDEIPNGQLITTLKAISFFRIKGSLIIHNCDTSYELNNDEIISLLNKEDIFGIIPCFKGNGDHWSFVKNNISNPSDAIEVQEKKRISDNCSLGTYVFSSAEQLQLLIESFIRSNQSNSLKEFFIAPIYQYAIEKNLIVKITYVNQVNLFGTPEELCDNFDVSYEELLGENSSYGHHKATLIVDIDKTICNKSADLNYKNAKPIDRVCRALRKANSDGVYIILFTSRNMRSFKGSLGLINKITAPILIDWLKTNKIPFDEIYFGKPWGNDVSYLDDKNLSIDNFLEKYSDF